MAVILAVITMNAILGTVQTVKAAASLDSLKQMSAPTAKVVRDGALQRLETDRLVPGDIIHLEAGDLVPADARILEAAVRGAGGRPVTVKFRLGWDKGSINCVEFAQAMEAAGVAAVAVHGRTKVQMYSGRANWDYIREIKQTVSIPVIANGDVFNAREAVHILSYTGADMAMIGRALSLIHI